MGTRPQEGGAGSVQRKHGRRDGGLVTCPDAQTELGRVQVHHIVPKNRFNTSATTDSNTIFLSRGGRGASSSCACPLEPLTRLLGSPAPGRLRPWCHQRRTRSPATSPMRGWRRSLALRMCGSGSELGGARGPERELRRRCAAASPAFALVGRAAPFLLGPRLFPHRQATEQVPGVTGHF